MSQNIKGHLAGHLRALPHKRTRHCAAGSRKQETNKKQKHAHKCSYLHLRGTPVCTAETPRTPSFTQPTDTLISDESSAPSPAMMPVSHEGLTLLLRTCPAREGLFSPAMMPVSHEGLTLLARLRLLLLPQLAHLPYPVCIFYTPPRCDACVTSQLHCIHTCLNNIYIHTCLRHTCDYTEVTAPS